MRWSAPEDRAHLEALASRFRAASWPDPPTGFTLVGAPRAMRRVVRGPFGSRASVVKWSRPVTTSDRIARALRGGKGPREGRLLRTLAERGVRVPRVLGYTDDGVDLLVLAALEDAEPLPPGPEAPRALVRATARLLGRAFAAGLRHRDLHRDNLLLVAGEPLLLDLGGARLAHDGGEVRELARLQHGLADGLSRAARLRAVAAWLEEAQVPALRPRDLVHRVDEEARRIRRRYRRGRDRRATRTGRHYEVFSPPGGGRGVRRRDTPEAWRTRALAWLRHDPPGAVELKAGGRVLRARLDGFDVVLKRYGPTARGRLPRAVAAFRKAVWLEHRGISAPRSLLAVAGRDGASLLVSEHVEGAVDLHRLLATNGVRPFSAVSWPRDRRKGSDPDLPERLGRFLRAMHDAEISHRDLKAPNLLAVDRPPWFLVADVDGVCRREVSWRRRARDLARLDASVAARDTDRLRVLDAYWRVLPRPPVDRHAFARWIARHVARKRGPSGHPR